MLTFIRPARGCVACIADALNLLYRGFRRVRGPAATQVRGCVKKV